MLTRPALRYHGGKWVLAPWLISLFPAHRVYVEPYGGAASVLLRKPRAYAEVYNDIDQDVVALFRVLRNPDQSAELVEMLRCTPFARDEFKAAYDRADCPIEQSRRLIVRSFMGFGSDGCNASINTGFRGNSNQSGTTPAHDWVNLPDAYLAITERLRGVVIENRDAKLVMAAHDGPETLHFVDPPYLHETRSSVGAYTHEMSEQDHEELIEFLKTLEGAVVLCGYPSEKYSESLTGWRRVDRSAFADGARKRTECVWLNSKAYTQGDLFQAGEGATC